MALSNQDARNLDPAGATSDADEALMEQMRLAEEGLADAPTAPAEPPRRRQRREEAALPPEPAQAQADGEEDAGEPAQTEQQPRTVPLGHLQEERERRKQVEAQLAEQRQQMRLLEERTNLLLQRQFAAPQPQQQAPQPEPLPDFAQYPAEHIVAKLAQQERELAQFRQVEQQRQQQLAGAQQLQQLEQRARSFEMTFSAEHPDYGQAVSYIMNQRHQELNTLGIRDPGERQTKIQQEALGLAAMAMQNGMNPAEVLYNLAAQRGYRAPAAIEAQPANGAANGHAEPAAAAPNAQQQQRLQQLADGQQQARSLSSARGQATPPPMTAERIAKMSDAQFMAWYDNGNADNRDIFGQ